MIEILVVIGIIAVLATIVIIAINPARQFAQSRNTQRTANVQAILNAVGQRIADNKGVFAGTVGAQTCPNLTTSGANALTAGTAYKIKAPAVLASNEIDLSCLVTTYIPSFPYDPSDAAAAWTSTAAYNTGYTIAIDASGRATVAAPTAELGTTISITR